MKRTPLLMYPNGTFAGSSTMVEGCVVVEEPELLDEEEKIIDQTEAVRKAEGNPNAEKRCVKAIKQLPNQMWRLKLQTGKYAHPLLIDDEGITHQDIKDFKTKEDALNSWQLWIDNLHKGDRGIKRAIADAYKSYAVNNEIYNESSFNSYFGENKNV